MPRTATKARSKAGSTRRGETDQASQSGLDFDSATGLFIEYLRTYRGYSDLTVSSYRTDLRQFREFAQSRLGRVPPPEEIERETIVQFAASLAGRAALTVRRKIACLSSFYAYLMDMGHGRHNPAHRVPLPKVAQKVPVTLDEDEARTLAQAGAGQHECKPLWSGHGGPLSELTLENQHLLAQGQDQAITVVSQQTADQDVEGTEQYRQRVPKHADRMIAGWTEVNGQEQSRISGAYPERPGAL